MPDGVAKQPEPSAPKGRSLFKQDIPDDEPDPVKQDPEPDPQPKAPDAGKEAPKGSIKQLREQYELTKREKADLESKVRELTEARETGTKAEVEKATKELREEVERIRKEREEAEVELRFSRYTKSNEYKTKYQQPLQKAYEQAMADIDGIVMVGEDGTERPASWQDLEPIFNAPTARAAQLAREMFGDASAVILQNRANVVRLQNEAKAAIEEYKAKGAEFEKQREAQAQAAREASVKAWRESMDRVVSERPKLYAKPEGDETLAKAWDTGDKLVRAAFLGELPPDVDVTDKDAFAVEAQAEVAARVRAFNVMAHRVQGLQSENAKLKARLAKLEASEPKAGSASGSSDPVKPASWMDKLDSL